MPLSEDLKKVKRKRIILLQRMETLRGTHIYKKLPADRLQETSVLGGVASLQPLCVSLGSFCFSLNMCFVLFPSGNWFFSAISYFFAFFVTLVSTGHWIDQVGTLPCFMRPCISGTCGCWTAVFFLLEKEQVSVSHWLSLVQTAVCQLPQAY